MAHIRYHRGTSDFAPAVSGAVDVDQTSLSLMAAKAPPKRRTIGWLCSTNAHLAALLLFYQQIRKEQASVTLWVLAHIRRIGSRTKTAFLSAEN